MVALRSTSSILAILVIAAAVSIASGCSSSYPADPPVKLLASEYSEERIMEAEPAEGAGDPAPVGKVRLGKDIREAVFVEAGTSVRWELSTSDQPRVLRYGFGMPPDTVMPRVMLVSGGGVGAELPLTRVQFGTDHARGWHNREATLPRCPNGPCWIEVEVGAMPDAEGRSGVAISSPVISGGAEPGKPNVVLISLDTLAADHLPAYGGPEGISPRIDSLAEEGVLFENAFANSSLTHTSHASMLTGASPFNSEYVWLDGSVQSQVTLADTLRTAGYLTAAFTGGVVLNEELRFDRGFDRFYQYNTLFRGPASRTDIEYLSGEALEWIRENADAPFFLLLHSYEVHGPFMDRSIDLGTHFSEPQVPLTEPGGQPRIFAFPHMRGRLPALPDRLPYLIKTFTPERKLVSTVAAETPVETVGPVEDAYRSEIGFTDAFVGAFLDTLAEWGLLDNTIVVLTSDHGEAFFEHGLLQHGLLYGETLRVPLIVRFPPRLPGGSRVASQVSLMDIAPTILDLAGIEIPLEMDGRSLVSRALGEPPAAGESPHRPFYGLVIGNGLFWQTERREKLILRAGLGRANYGKVELFDLIDDPTELNNLATGDGIPQEHRLMVWQTIESMPGVHIDLNAYAGQTHEVEIPWPQAVRDRMYGFDIDSTGCSVERSPDRLACTMKFSDTSRMVMMDRRRQRSLDIVLRPYNERSGDTISFRIGSETVTTQPKPVVPFEGEGPPLVAWRRNELVPDRSPLSEEQLERLRSLGYIQ